ncbi:hypothetical protein [Enterobacter mori]|uniref:hypothetical protein n=1 Tax=Enterobacter mori TaxID=539813 RepID=UPI003A0FD54C
MRIRDQRADIRVYGEFRTDETARRHGKGHSESNNAAAENPQLEEIQKQLSDLQQSVTLMLEDKTARKAEISRLNEVLKQEKKEVSGRGFSGVTIVRTPNGSKGRFRRKTYETTNHPKNRQKRPR